jgi:flavin-binding protein dodecin
LAEPQARRAGPDEQVDRPRLWDHAGAEFVKQEEGRRGWEHKVIELVGTSTDSWEKAAAAAVEKASGSLRDLRIAEIAELDLQIENGKVRAYRARVKVSFKYEDWAAAEAATDGHPAHLHEGRHQWITRDGECIRWRNR